MMKILIVFFSVLMAACSSLENVKSGGDELNLDGSLDTEELLEQYKRSEVKVKIISTENGKKELQISLDYDKYSSLKNEFYDFRLVYANETFDCFRRTVCYLIPDVFPLNHLDPEAENDLRVFINPHNQGDANLTKRLLFKIPNRMAFNYYWIVKRDRSITFSQPSLKNPIKEVILSKGYKFKYTNSNKDSMFVQLDGYDFGQKNTIRNIWVPRASLDFVIEK